MAGRGKGRVCAGLGLKVDAKGVVVHRVAHGRGQGAGVAVVALARQKREADAVGALHLRRPAALVKALRAAVELVFAVVCGERVFPAAERKARVRDPSRNTADNGAGAAFAVKILLRRAVAERDGTAVVFDGADRRAQREHGNGQSAGADHIFFIAEKV